VPQGPSSPRSAHSGNVMSMLRPARASGRKGSALSNQPVWAPAGSVARAWLDEWRRPGLGSNILTTRVDRLRSRAGCARRLPALATKGRYREAFHPHCLRHAFGVSAGAVYREPAGAVPSAVAKSTVGVPVSLADWSVPVASASFVPASPSTERSSRPRPWWGRRPPRPDGARGVIRARRRRSRLRCSRWR
jgi:hypothetical protein